MSTVSITITLDRYICTELNEVRTMIKNLDFSTLPAIVERIQKHANAMEDALRNYNYYMSDIKDIVKNDVNSPNRVGDAKVYNSAEEQLEAIKAVLMKKYPEW